MDSIFKQLQIEVMRHLSVILFSAMFICNALTVNAQIYGNQAFETEPTWSDEFNYKGFPDNKIWVITQARQKEQDAVYVKNKKNCYVKGGNLNLTLRKVAKGDTLYESGRIYANSAHHIKYGKLQLRAKCSTVKGAWEALWLRSVGNAANGVRGEIDCMEYIGDWGKDKFQINFHLRGNFSGKNKNHKQYPKFPDIDISKWHIYTVEWYPNRIMVYIDNILFYDLKKGDIPEWPFENPYMLIMAFGYKPNWSKTKETDDNALPQTLKVDYVRYYKYKENQ